MKKSTKAWIELAKRDIKVAEKILNDAYLANIVAFHSQQAVEKAIKALLEEHSLKVPKTHNVSRLFEMVPKSLKSVLKIKEDDLDRITDIYIDSRYPSDVGLLPSGFPTKDEAERIFRIARNIFKQILKAFKGKSK